MNGSIINKMVIPLIKRIDHKVNVITPDAPYQIKPHKDEITKYYPPPYYSWINNNSIDINFFKKYDSIDGILGFSQGSSIALNLAEYLNPKFIINISGVDKLYFNRVINTPSIHVIGLNDPYYLYSKNLNQTFLYDDLYLLNFQREFI